MKFSILLPTKNRLDLLKYALESVIKQEYADWEIIITDQSDESIKEYIDSLGESRIKYYQIDSTLSVTANWNAAMDRSTGDYVIMLGDDDSLTKGYFKKISKLTQQDPELIYTGALQYSYPGVFKKHPKGYLEPYNNAPFFKETPSILKKEEAHKLVKDMLNFKMTYTYNMQHAVISRRAINKLTKDGAFFRSPYPDFYAMNALMLESEKIIITSEHLVIIGISKKSFGYFYFNNKEETGVQFLNNSGESPEIITSLSDIVLPGVKDLTNWLIAAEHLKRKYGAKFNLTVNYDRYRYLEIINTVGKYFLEKKRYSQEERLKAEGISREVRLKMRPLEKALFLPSLWFTATFLNLLPYNFARKMMITGMTLFRKSPQIDPKKQDKTYENILEVYEAGGENGKEK